MAASGNPSVQGTPSQIPEQGDFERILSLLRNHIALIAVCVLATTGSALVFSLLQEKQYTASASLLFRDPGFAQTLYGAQITENVDPTREAATNVKLVGLDTVASRAAEALGGDLTGLDVAKRVEVSAEGQSNVVSVSATDPDPSQAKLIANTFAREFVQFRADADRSKLQHAQQVAENQLDRLSLEDQASARGQALSSAAEKLGVLASLQTGNAELVQPAEVPTSPSAPKTKRNALLGAILGLLLGVGLAFLSERLNRRLRDADEARAEFGLPVVGTIPRSSALDSGMGWLPFPEEEAFRTLRAALRYFNVDRDVHSVLVTSGSAEEGKSTVSWHLARTAAASGSAVLVEADLRHPSVAVTHGFFPAPGLAELLTHQVPLNSAIQKLDITAETSESNGGTRDLDVIVAGRMPPNPAELLESEAMRALLTDLMLRYDFVVVDTPPTGVVSDAFPLLSQVSGVIVVCRLGTTTRDAAAKLRAQLERLHAPLLGVVANCVRQPRRRDRYGYGYYESYYGGIPTREETPSVG